jgi:hypothetical protein
MPDDEIAQRTELLTAHRRTLAHLLVQRAQFSTGNVPAHIANGIAEARAQISDIKASLRAAGITLLDHPDDMERATTALELHTERRNRMKPNNEGSVISNLRSEFTCLTTHAIARRCAARSPETTPRRPIRGRPAPAGARRRCPG